MIEPKSELEEEQQTDVKKTSCWGDHDFPRSHSVQSLFRDPSWAILHLRSAQPEVLRPQQISHGCRVDPRRFPAVWTNGLPEVIATCSELQGSANLTSIYMNDLRFRARRWSDAVSAEELWKRDRERLFRLGSERRGSMIDKGIEITPGDPGNLEHHCFEVVLHEIHAPYLFPTTVAIEMIKRFGRRDRPGTTRVLDISAGWGDRLIACLLLPEHCSSYYGCDPHLAMTVCYRQMVEHLACSEEFGLFRHEARSRFRVDPVPFEDCEIPWKKEGRYDLLLTSPPFFQLEHYSDDPGQSTLRYNDVESWLVRFLFVCLAKCNEALNPGAYAVIHLRDLVDYTPQGTHNSSCRYVQRFLEFCTGKLGWRYLGCIGYTRRTRCGFVRSFDGTYPVQPLWILQKPDSA